MGKTYYVKRTGDNSDELYHWKYIKREKKNGKWRYYYDRNALKKDINDKLGFGIERDWHDAKQKYDNATGARKYHQGEFDYVDGKVRSGEFFDKDNGNESMVRPYRDNLINAAKEYGRAGQKFYETDKAYKNTPIYKIEKMEEKILKGNRTISNWLREKFN